MKRQDLIRSATTTQASIAEARAGATSLLSAQVWLSIAGWVLLGLWALWWGLNFVNHVLVFGGKTLVPVWHWLGLDLYHNYLGSIAWLSGRDPYLHFFGDDRGSYAYPPIVLPIFGWSVWVSFPIAAVIFACVIAMITAVATFLSLRFRRAAGSLELPAALSVGAVLTSLPVVFAMERGQYDALALMLLLIAAWAMVHGKGLRWDLLAGFALAIALWIKVYPGILFLAPLAMRRYRLFVIAVLASCAIGAASLGLTVEWLGSLASSQSARVGPIGELKDWLTGNGPQDPVPLSFDEMLLSCSHSLTTYWPLFWGRLGAMWLAQIPSLLCAGLALGALTLLGCYRLFRARVDGWIVYPFLLWLASLATFLMPLSYDYNMIYFPLLIVAVWDRRDPWWVQALLLPALLWWLPYNLNLPMQADVLNIAKLVSLGGVSVCLLRRIGETETPGARRAGAVIVPTA